MIDSTSKKHFEMNLNPRHIKISTKLVDLPALPGNIVIAKPFCWIDSKTLAVGYNARENDDNPRDTEYPSEILFIDVEKNAIINHIPFNGFAINQEYGEVSGELFFNQNEAIFIGLNSQNGLTIADITGNVLFRDAELTDNSYFVERQRISRFLCDTRQIEIKYFEWV
jgi:hypothetical protein